MRALPVLLCLSGLPLVLAGCGGGGDREDPTATETADMGDTTIDTGATMSPGATATDPMTGGSATGGAGAMTGSPRAGATGTAAGGAGATSTGPAATTTASPTGTGTTGATQ